MSESNPIHERDSARHDLNSCLIWMAAEEERALEIKRSDDIPLLAPIWNHGQRHETMRRGERRLDCEPSVIPMTFGKVHLEGWEHFQSRGVDLFWEGGV